MRNKNQRGFTLIELLVVIAIIGLLAAVVLLAVNSAREKAREAKRLADVTQLATVFELFYSAANAYPTGSAYIYSTPASGAMLGSAGLQATDQNSNIYYLTPTYTGILPVAPAPADDPPGLTTCSGTSGAGGNNYWYQTDNNGDTYTLTFCLGGNGSGQYGAGTHYLTPDGVQ